MYKLKDFITLAQTDEPGKFLVKLHFSEKVKVIGLLDTAGDGTFHSVRKSKEKHQMHQGDLIGLNYALMKSDYIKFKWVVISVEGSLLVTSRNYALQHGQPMQFKGYELQLFLKRDEMKIGIAKRFEEELTKQGVLEKPEPNLFGDLFEEVPE